MKYKMRGFKKYSEYRITWFIRLPLVRWNKVGAEVKHSIQSEKSPNKPDFDRKGLSEGVLLRIWDRLLRKLLSQRIILAAGEKKTR